MSQIDKICKIIYNNKLHDLNYTLHYLLFILLRILFHNIILITKLCHLVFFILLEQKRKGQLAFLQWNPISRCIETHVKTRCKQKSILADIMTDVNTRCKQGLCRPLTVPVFASIFSLSLSGSVLTPSLGRPCMCGVFWYENLFP